MRTGSITIEEVTSLDPIQDSEVLHQLCELLIDVVADGASIGFLHPVALEEARNYWLSVLQNGVKLWIAKDEHNVIAGTIQLHLVLKKNGLHRAEVAKLMVHPAHRRKGIAWQLLHTMEDTARVENRSLLILDTREGDPSNKLYQSHGYIEVGRTPNFVINEVGEFQATINYYKIL
ncbi:GNAT family N-acetyltransferase [Paenibacillus sp. N1-5-1-14]|uniref:GNAT family N-acetyltransferase n=1 Tax=Paenibacillus radicibacter TaxID=2972488 RepID=UPI0021597050|nr:GNAT family N-acetyltransferase [Paenibacillus radicibacter]MCR8644518.1 GNAT family N-acetyltransferase [Paenibacillus radicibacter]